LFLLPTRASGVTTALTRKLYSDGMPCLFFSDIQNQSQAMKANITLNARPLLRALYVVLITCIALLAVPRRADAQVYVSQSESGVVSEYDEKTGEVINANFITGLTEPNELVLSGEVLYVANAGGSVGKYDAKTGAAISQSFIIGTDFAPIGLALSGEDIFVMTVVQSGTDGTVGKYHEKTGKVINASFITGLAPGGLGALGDSIFVASYNSSTVGKYSAKTGKLIYNQSVAFPYGIAFLGDNLFVGGLTSGTIGKYNAKNGEVIDANFITGLNMPYQIAILDDKLFVVGYGSGTVSEFDAKNGAVINLLFISGLSSGQPAGIAVKAQKK
jgi:WD40 repeat protein